MKLWLISDVYQQTDIDKEATEEENSEESVGLKALHLAARCGVCYRCRS